MNGTEFNVQIETGFTELMKLIAFKSLNLTNQCVFLTVEALPWMIFKLLAV